MSQLAPVLPDTSALDIPAVLMPYQQRWVADTSPLKVIEKSRRTGITWAEASDDVLTAASSAPAGGMNVYYIAYNQDMTVEYIQACAMWARAFNYAASEIEEGFWEEDEDDKHIKTYTIKFPTPVSALSRSPVDRRTCVAVRASSLSTKRRSMSNWTNC
jgi:phage FluMu gp28-like protein